MTTGKETGVAFAKTLIAGVKAHLSNATTVTFGSATYTTAQIEAFLQTLIDLRTAVDEAKAAAKAKISAEAAQTPALRSQVAALVLYVRATFGNSPDVLADFGITPKKAPTPLTIGQKATAAAKRAATRAARHTMGPKKKLAVKGAATVTTIVTQPVASTPAPITPAAGAPSGTGAAPGTSPVATAAPPGGASGVTASRNG